MFGPGPRENLIEDDGAEGCGANPSHREGANPSVRSPAPAVSAAATVIKFRGLDKFDLILYPDPACHGGDQAKQHDRQTTDNGARDRENQSTEFGRETQQDRDDGSGNKQKSSNRPL